jgi:hypothetical protein
MSCPRGVPDFELLNAACRLSSSAHQLAGTAGVTEMLDIIMLAIGLGFFVLSVGYTIACDQL